MREHKIFSKFSILFLAGLFLLAGVFGLLPTAAHAVGDSITITGNGVYNPGVTFTQDELQDDNILPQHTVLYSTINTWPTKSWCRGEGVKVSDLLAAAGGLKPEAVLIKFTSRDGFTTTFTIQEFIHDPRYCFPHFMDNGIAGHIPGDPAEAVAVEPIIAHRSCSAQNIADVMNDDNMSQGDANHLLFGQRAVTEQTNAIFVKYVTTIEVLTTEPDQWDEPTANPDSGTVSAGTMVELQGPFNDLDKVHYTVDGSTPTVSSPMYNWIASRWSSREDFDEVNHPIEITGDTAIKALVIGPGKENSDIVTFNYRVQTVAITGVGIAEGDQQLEVNQTVQVTAEVQPENATDKGVTWSTSDQSVATVNETGLVTAIAAGTATITVTTNDGEFSDTITVTVANEPTGSDLVINKANPAKATKNKAYAGHTFTVTGGVEPYSFAVTDGALPKGTSLNGAALEGTPTESGTFVFIITVTDNADPAKTVNHEFTLVVEADGVPYDEEVVLTIKGDGVTNPGEFTLSQLEGMQQHQYVYSVINTWPSKKWYVGKGVKVKDLLDEAGVKGNARQIRFSSSDGYYMTLTVQELLEERRYRFPNFMAGGDDGGHIPGSSSGAVEVESILALVGADTDNPSYMNDANALQLMVGQRAVTEQTDPMFVKYVNEVEVLTSAPGKWDKPKADPDGGTVPAGTLVELKNNNMDMDKIYYTVDDSTPTMDSTMYNPVAKRWWPARGKEVVAEINHPLELTKDTTIKAVTIGPGRSNSDIVTFTYKITEATAAATDAIIPGKGGAVSLGSEVTIEIPANALTGTNPVEVMIERVTTPPTAPAGFKILGSVFEFSVDGNNSYSFAKEVIIKLSFDPEAVTAGETLAVHCYDKTAQQWVNIGGEVSGDTVTVQVNHCTKFAVMVFDKLAAAETITPGKGGIVSLEDEAAMEIPANALAGTRPVEITIERVTMPPTALAGFKILGNVYEFSVDGKASYNFEKEVTIKLGFDPEVINVDEIPSIHYYDETEKKWVNIGGEVSGNTVIVQVDHFTKFAVMVAMQMKGQEQILTDIVGHWAEDSIKELVALGAVAGYPDGSFKPNNKITRAEFASILVKALKLELQRGKVFADTTGHWAKDTIATATYHGIVSGYGADMFGPNDVITREQMAAMVVNVAKLTPVTEGMSFKDSSSISDWAGTAVATAIQHGIINGYPDNTVRSRGNATRAEAAEVIVNALHSILND
ncbi:S-layer homology domain-containing protein [Desulfoscipio gibsoniae]|uniref:Ig-like domain-containing surface protein n=1 Tax=Desulfoscipio gibsoniae DSM 7213 TaxID=767817 RepID=R4KJS2_9FIRM|nr:S-layer homology domain-containing protein [Desulfoscipio gibsoniae]AGK99880.1 Ig-like domain-containing surface protein [Desulfoscipio gibsoniae DSM 7213]